jgi:hypothetical protein
VTIQSQWQDVMEMSHAMLSAAQAQEWEVVPRMEAERRILIEAFFENNVLATQADEVASGIHELMAIDREMMTLCDKSKESMSHQLGNLTQGRRARVAYTQNS